MTTSLLGAAALIMAAVSSPAPREYEGPGQVVYEGEEDVLPAAAQPLEPPAPAEPDALAPLSDVEFEDEADGYDPLRDAPEAVEARTFLRGGAILLTTGAVLSVGAVAMGLTDPCKRTGGNSCQRSARDRAALTLGIPGGLIMAGGAALLTIGVKKRREHRANVSAGVLLRGHAVGVSVRGRF